MVLRDWKPWTFLGGDSDTLRAGLEKRLPKFYQHHRAFLDELLELTEDSLSTRAIPCKRPTSEIVEHLVLADKDILSGRSVR